MTEVIGRRYFSSKIIEALSLLDSCHVLSNKIGEPAVVRELPTRKNRPWPSTNTAWVPTKYLDLTTFELAGALYRVLELVRAYGQSDLLYPDDDIEAAAHNAEQDLLESMGASCEQLRSAGARSAKYAMPLLAKYKALKDVIRQRDVLVRAGRAGPLWLSRWCRRCVSTVEGTRVVGCARFLAATSRSLSYLRATPAFQEEVQSITEVREVWGGKLVDASLGKEGTICTVWWRLVREKGPLRFAAKLVAATYGTTIANHPNLEIEIRRKELVALAVLGASDRTLDIVRSDLAYMPYDED